MDAAFTELKERVAEIADLEAAGALLGWDQQVKMPPGGAEVRAEQLATLGRLAHEALTSDEIGGLLDRLQQFRRLRGQVHDNPVFHFQTRLFPQLLDMTNDFPGYPLPD